VVDRGHGQYAGRLSLADQLRHVLQGHGQSGINRDYVLATVKAIEAEGFRDQPLHRLAMMLHDQHRAALPRTATAEPVCVSVTATEMKHGGENSQVPPLTPCGA
jgi:hypothetical protein